MRRLTLLSLSCLVFYGIYADTCVAQSPSQIQFADVTDASGVDFTHSDGSSGKHFLVEAVASGMASFDYDNDGRIDLYFLSGAALEGTKYDRIPANELWRNVGQMKFTNETTYSRLGDSTFGLGVTVGDFDNDGFDDVYLSNHGANVLFQNLGDGTFSPVVQSSLACGNSTGGGCCMLDIDGDGDLDIYAANYLQFDYDIPASEFRGRMVYGGPLLYPKETDHLLLNLGDGEFVDVSRERGIDSAREWGMGTICFDFDSDGDTDIFVANDSTRNLLYENDGDGNFEDIALLSGIAYDHRGDPQGSMGIDVADFNGDQEPDLFQTAYTKQQATLYQNLGGSFLDATLRTGAGKGSFYHVNWGTGFADFDNDGDKDIFFANGHIHDNMDDLDDTVSYRISNQVMENISGKKFLDVSATAGSGLEPKHSSRAIAIEDFNLDGKPDVAILNSREKATLLRNNSASRNHWVAFDLVGTQSNRDAVGTRVSVTAGGQTQVLEIHSGRSYQSHFGSRLHFGVGDMETIDMVEVSWHGHEIQKLQSLRVDSLYLIRQGHEAIRCMKNL